MRSIRNAKGFTLIELMIVVVIIGILAAIAIPKFSQASDRAKEKEADGILKQVYTIQETWKAANGEHTTDVDDLISVGFEAPTNLKHYDIPTDWSLPLCMQPSGDTPTHKSRQIDEDGEITSDC